MEIHNTSLTAPLEFIVPCNSLFSETRLISQGTVIDQLSFLPRLSAVLDATLPTTAKELNGQEQFKKMKLQKLYFYWTTRNQGAFGWFGDLLTSLNPAGGHGAPLAPARPVTRRHQRHRLPL